MRTRVKYFLIGKNDYVIFSFRKENFNSYNFIFEKNVNKKKIFQTINS